LDPFAPMVHPCAWDWPIFLELFLATWPACRRGFFLVPVPFLSETVRGHPLPFWRQSLLSGQWTNHWIPPVRDLPAVFRFFFLYSNGIVSACLFASTPSSKVGIRAGLFPIWTIRLFSMSCYYGSSCCGRMSPFRN